MIAQVVARNAPRECVAAIVMIVNGTVASMTRRINGRRSERPSMKSSGMPIVRASAKSLLSAIMPPGPSMMTSEPPETIPAIPFFTP